MKLKSLIDDEDDGKASSSNHAHALMTIISNRKYLIAKEIGNNKYLIPFAIAGSLVGGLIGSEIGENLDSRVASNVLEKNKLNETTKWKNPDTDLTASITPTKTFKNDLNDDCREFEYSYTHKGESSEGKNIACRDINGNWELITPDIKLSPL